MKLKAAIKKAQKEVLAAYQRGMMDGATDLMEANGIDPLANAVAITEALNRKMGAVDTLREVMGADFLNMRLSEFEQFGRMAGEEATREVFPHV